LERVSQMQLDVIVLKSFRPLREIIEFSLPFI
jgi:hypothetical protein